MRKTQRYIVKQRNYDVTVKHKKNRQCRCQEGGHGTNILLYIVHCQAEEALRLCQACMDQHCHCQTQDELFNNPIEHPLVTVKKSNSCHNIAEH
jgi:hypothetical protein